MKEKIQLGLIILLAFFIRIPALFQSLWLDEAIQVQAVREISYWDLIRKYAIGDFHPPFYHLFLKTWTLIFGFSEISVRTPSLLFGLGTVFLVYKIGEILGNKRVGFLACLFFAFAPLHVYYSAEARMYSMAAFLATFSIYFFLKLFEQNKLTWIFFFLSTLALLYTEYVPYLLLPVFWLYVFWQRKNLPPNFPKNWLVTNLLLIIFLLPWLPLLLSQLAIGQEVQGALPAWKQVVGSFSLVALPLTAAKFVGGRISSFNKTFYGVTIGLATLFFFLLLLKSAFSQVKRKILLFLWLFLPVFLGWVVSIFIPIFLFFRFLFSLPPLYLLLASSTVESRRSLLILFSLLVLLISISSILIFYTTPRFHRENWRSASLYIQEKISHEGDIPVILSFGGKFAPFEYYQRGFSYGGPEILSSEAKELIFVPYLAPIFDPSDSTRKEIEAKGFRRTGEKDFNGVLVWEYKK